MTSPEVLALPENYELEDWVAAEELAAIAGEKLSGRLVCEITASWDESVNHVQQNGQGEIYSPLFTKIFTRALEILEPNEISTREEEDAALRSPEKAKSNNEATTHRERQASWGYEVIETIEEIPVEDYPAVMKSASLMDSGVPTTDTNAPSKKSSEEPVRETEGHENKDKKRRKRRWTELPYDGDGPGEIRVSEEFIKSIFIHHDWEKMRSCDQNYEDSIFPERGGSASQIKNQCVKCEVQGDCLTQSLIDKEKFGIWGGVNVKDRKTLQSKLDEGISMDQIVRIITSIKDPRDLSGSNLDEFIDNFQK